MLACSDLGWYPKRSVMLLHSSVQVVDSNEGTYRRTLIHLVLSQKRWRRRQFKVSSKRQCVFVKRSLLFLSTRGKLIRRAQIWKDACFETERGSLQQSGWFVEVTKQRWQWRRRASASDSAQSTARARLIAPTFPGVTNGVLTTSATRQWEGVDDSKRVDMYATRTQNGRCLVMAELAE